MSEKLLFTSKKDNVQSFSRPDEAVAYIKEIYETNTSYLRNNLEAMFRGEAVPDVVSACYPYAAIEVGRRDLHRDSIDPKASYGFVSNAGRYETTLTRPDIFADYYKDMLKRIIHNHAIPIEVGVSKAPIPIHYAFPNGMQVEGGLTDQKLQKLHETFDSVPCDYVDDDIVSGQKIYLNGQVKPLALYTAARVDYSLHRLRHYTGTDPSHFQNFVLFTNYPFYIDEFRSLGHDIMKKTDDPARQASRALYTSFVEPGNHTIYNQNGSAQEETGQPAARVSQMPAYHLTRADHNGITIINIGVSAPNAQNIAEHVAVMRPHAWNMVGLCAGFNQKRGDYVLANGYDRKDRVLDEFIPPSTDIPPIAEIQTALQKAVEQIAVKPGQDVRDILRTGTVQTTTDRNWEMRGWKYIKEHSNPSSIVALEMESATLAGVGYLNRVPYGTLLCVSDIPTRGDPKMAGSAETFYRERVSQHVHIAVRACELLCENTEALHSRKLRRPFDEPAFR